MWLQLECLVPAAAELRGIAIKIKDKKLKNRLADASFYYYDLNLIPYTVFAINTKNQQERKKEFSLKLLDCLVKQMQSNYASVTNEYYELRKELLK